MSSQPDNSSPLARCGATTKKTGKPCVWHAHPDGDGRCWRHAPGLELVRQETYGRLQALAATAKHEQAQARALSAGKALPLRGIDDCLSALERALAQVEASQEKSTEKAKAVASLVTQAAALLKNTLEEENDDLRRLLTEKHPEITARLRRAVG